MTSDTTLEDTTQVTGDDFEISDEEIARARHQMVFGRPEHLGPDVYPRLFNMSAGFAYEAVLRAHAPARPEYVTVPMGRPSFTDGDGLRMEIAVSQWNASWEAAQFRRRIFGEDDLPAQLYRIADKGDHNVVFVPRTRSRYYEHAPLFHLLPASTLERFGLPQLAAGQWPFSMRTIDIDDHLPGDFSDRLARAWAATVWRHLLPGSPLRGFAKDDPLRVLAHNLDFWLPPVTDVIQDVLGCYPIVDNGHDTRPVRLQDGSTLPGVELGNPRAGGDVWSGADEAAEIVEEVVAQADQTGRLRGIIEAVRSNRVVDDFSDVWSYEKEDFERRLYRKRAKVSVKFVELSDTIPVQGPETQVIGSIVHAEFLALLNAKDREVVVLLNSGFTHLTDIAREMGYANHSPISKRLARIREQAEAFFDRA